MSIEDKKNEVQVTNFLQLTTANRNRIYGYILSVVPNKSLADDILQETITIMWQKFENFRPESDFVSWGIAIARFRVMTHRSKQKREANYLNEHAIELLNEQAYEYMQDVDDRLVILRECVKKLEKDQRELLHQRYDQETPVKSISQKMGSSTKTIYKTLSRIQDILLRCVRRNMIQEDQV
ncbi:MAG: sigma-70 family RNA polymerase sigma factor [Phycisphaerae bacterium]|nr:sigma-70 family RNA polymerase sigma factor [Phycisphaerae bacterium]